MSREDHDKQADLEFVLAELRGEGVNISEETAKKAVERHYSKPLHERVPVPRGFAPSHVAGLADTGT